MLRFLLRRLLLTVPVLFGLTALVFAIARLLPGDPVALAAGPNASAAEIAAYAKEFGLDRPLLTQYFEPVVEDLAAYLPATLELVFAAMALAMMVGIPLGLWAGVRRDAWPDVVSRTLALGAISMPRFFLGLLLQLAFAMALGWLPLGGRYPITLDPPALVTGFLTVDALLAGDFEAFATACRHLVMPALAMSLSPLATLMRMMRASTIVVLQQDYVLTERALGLPQRLIVLKYVARNAISATLTVTGLYFGWLLGGTVLVETVFDWPGLGLYATKSVVTQDFMPVIGVTLVIGTLFVAANLVVDLLYGWVDPKVRQG
jgi:peptide/nickel transport system permease protein